jgi:hypothetical protein
LFSSCSLHRPSRPRPIAPWRNGCRAGGSVVVEGAYAGLDITQLPAGEFHVRTVNLVATTVKPKDFQRLSGLDHLKELYVSGRTWHSRRRQRR